MLIFINNRKITIEKQIDIKIYISDHYIFVFDNTNEKTLYKNRLFISHDGFNYCLCINNITNNSKEYFMYTNTIINLSNINNIEIKKYYDINNCLNNILIIEVICY